MKRTESIFFVLIFLLAPLATVSSAQEAQGRELKAALVGHAHIDLSWLWRWEETVHEVAVQTFLGTLDQMAKRPGLTFAQSQAALYEAMEKEYPDIWKRIAEKVKEGTWVPVGGMWVEPDLNMTAGESLARQLLYGQSYFKEKLGRAATVGWSPDAFGHNWQLPQILAQAGIRYYVFERCAPENTPFFWWQGLDGSRLLAYVPPGWYLVDLKQGVAGLLAAAARHTPVRDFMLLYGAGDHGGGPRPSDLEAMDRYAADPGHPRLRFAVPDEYFAALAAQNPSLPVVDRELNFTFPACYTTQAAVKKGNRRGEDLLLAAENFSALALFFGFRDYYPERDIDEAWKIVLRNQFHDILDGSSIGPVYRDALDYYQEAFIRGRRALDFSLECIAAQIETRGEDLPFIVFNPLCWERSDAVEAEVQIAGRASDLGLVDAAGRQVALQVLEELPVAEGRKVRFLFVAENVPASGYAVFRLLENGPPAAAPGLKVGKRRLENEFFRVDVDPQTGWIRGILDKRLGREVLAGPANVLQAAADDPESMSAWELGIKGGWENIGGPGSSRVAVVERGPVRAVIRVQHPFRNSFFRQDIVLYRGLPRIDCRVSGDWQERQVMVKAFFPVAVDKGKASFEIPFGHVERPADGTEVPALTWIDLSGEDGRNGVSLLNDCKYGFDIKGNGMRISLVHGATYPDPQADRGRHESFYSLYPHAGNWREAQTVRRGRELNSPLIVFQALAAAGKLPSRHSFLRIEPENIVVTALKKERGYDRRAIVLRLYESWGRRTEVTVALPQPLRAFACDLLEKSGAELPAADGRIRFTVAPHEIKTIKLIPEARE